MTHYLLGIFHLFMFMFFLPLQHLNINLVFTAFIIVFGSSFQFGYNIGVLNSVSKVK